MTLEELLAVAEIVEKLTNRYRDQEAAHKAALTEIRASFNARTSADGKRYEGILDTYRSELDEIDAALNPEREESTALVAKRLVEERDALRAEVARLKSQTTKHPVTKHPVKVGEWIKRLTPSPMTPAGGVAKVTDVFEVLGLAVKIERPDGLKGTWWAKSCEPCDPPNHDTEAGKAAAESAAHSAGIDIGTWSRKVTT